MFYLNSEVVLEAIPLFWFIYTIDIPFSSLMKPAFLQPSAKTTYPFTHFLHPNFIVF